MCLRVCIHVYTCVHMCLHTCVHVCMCVHIFGGGVYSMLKNSQYGDHSFRITNKDL